MQVLNSKLDANPDAGGTRTDIKSVILYEGSITNFDSRLHGFDIGTCLEVFLNPFYIPIIVDFIFFDKMLTSFLIWCVLNQDILVLYYLYKIIYDAWFVWR